MLRSELWARHMHTTSLTRARHMFWTGPLLLKTRPLVLHALKARHLTVAALDHWAEGGPLRRQRRLLQARGNFHKLFCLGKRAGDKPLHRPATAVALGSASRPGVRWPGRHRRCPPNNSRLTRVVECNRHTTYVPINPIIDVSGVDWRVSVPRTLLLN
eukprot:1932631-Amphidinium_carterae.1